LRALATGNILLTLRVQKIIQTNKSSDAQLGAAVEETEALLPEVWEETGKKTRCDVDRISRGVNAVAARQLKVVAARVYACTNGCGVCY